MFSRSLIVLSTALTLALANPLTARQDGGTAFNVTIVDFHSVFTPGAAGSISCTLDTAANSGAAVVTCNLIVPAGEPIQSDTRDYECPDFKVYQIRCDTVGRLTVGITRFCNETDMPIPVTSADNFTGFQECTQAAPALYKPIIHD